jgi:hypothetical protein
MRRLNVWLVSLLLVLSIGIATLPGRVTHAQSAQSDNGVLTVPSENTAAAQDAAACGRDKTFFGLPVWYKYLKVENLSVDTTLKNCRFVIEDSTDYWLIGLAVIEMLLRLVGILAVGFVIYGGFRYLISQGEPDNTKKALQTIINALIGAAIAVIASAVVSFIAGRLIS